MFAATHLRTNAEKDSPSARALSIRSSQLAGNGICFVTKFPGVFLFFDIGHAP
jgi:hypothetical protein